MQSKTDQDVGGGGSRKGKVKVKSFLSGWLQLSIVGQKVTDDKDNLVFPLLDLH